MGEVGWVREGGQGKTEKMKEKPHEEMRGEGVEAGKGARRRARTRAHTHTHTTEREREREKGETSSMRHDGGGEGGGVSLVVDEIAADHHIKSAIWPEALRPSPVQVAVRQLVPPHTQARTRRSPAPRFHSGPPTRRHAHQQRQSHRQTRDKELETDRQRQRHMTPLAV